MAERLFEYAESVMSDSDRDFMVQTVVNHVATAEDIEILNRPPNRPVMPLRNRHWGEQNEAKWKTVYALIVPVEEESVRVLEAMKDRLSSVADYLLNNQGRCWGEDVARIIGKA